MQARLDQGHCEQWREQHCNGERHHERDRDGVRHGANELTGRAGQIRQRQERRDDRERRGEHRHGEQTGRDEGVGQGVANAEHSLRGSPHRQFIAIPLGHRAVRLQRGVRLHLRAVLGFDGDIGLGEAFAEVFTKMGGTVVGKANYSGKDTDFSAILAQVAQKNPDILYLPDYYNIVNLATKPPSSSVAISGGVWAASLMDVVSWRTWAGEVQFHPIKTTPPRFLEPRSARSVSSIFVPLNPTIIIWPIFIRSGSPARAVRAQRSSPARSSRVIVRVQEDQGVAISGR